MLRKVLLKIKNIIEILLYTMLFWASIGSITTY